ncbi:hypothetical protein Stsp01_13690 [Streptomyces sp. NBRC 13847]|nr:hypothetical protein Stsp01_13690 [Streptomyces sp. NBRC 13847]
MPGRGPGTRRVARPTATGPTRSQRTSRGAPGGAAVAPDRRSFEKKELIVMNVIELQQLATDVDDAPMPPDKSTLSIAC